MQTSGLILDMHDDNRGEVIREIYPTLEAVPELVKQAQRLSQDDLASLPDDCFALVLKQGDVVLRKYACIDPGNTELAIQYFLKTAHKLPTEAAKLAAENLQVACRWYDIDPPEELLKEAFLAPLAKALPLAARAAGLVSTASNVIGGAKAGGEAIKGLGNTSSLIKGFSASDKMAAANNVLGKEAGLKRIQRIASSGLKKVYSGGKLEGLEHAGETAMEKMRRRVAKYPSGQEGYLPRIGLDPANPPAGTHTMSEALLHAKPTGPMGKSSSSKMADLTFTETMPAASSRTRNPEPKKAVITKTGGVGRQVTRHHGDAHYPQVNAPVSQEPSIAAEKDWDMQLTTGAPSGRQFTGRVMAPNIEVRGKEGPDKPVYEKKASKHALGDRYPLDNLLQIKQAVAYFDEFGCRMPPADRHEYCVNMVKAASAVGLDVSEEARKYGAERYAPADEMKVAMDVRKRALLDDQHHQMLDGLFEKRATMSPHLFCQALEHFDHMTGLHHYYDQYVPDAFWSTYGVEKQAEFLEVIGNDSVTTQQLQDLVRVGGGGAGSAVQLLNKAFGQEFTEELRKDPVGIFSSLPRDQKIYLMRLANDNAPSGMGS